MFNEEINEANATGYAEWLAEATEEEIEAAQEEAEAALEGSNG